MAIQRSQNAGTGTFVDVAAELFAMSVSILSF
jgi:hypothetical protein